LGLGFAIPVQNRSQQFPLGLLHFFPSPIAFITNTGHRRPVFVLLPFAFSISQYILGPLLFLLSMFIILIVLLQRGRGGGLAGALGGAGGSSALGVKAGDIFTRITAVAVLIWIVLCAFVCWYYLEPPPDIAADPSSDVPALTVGPKDGTVSGNPAGANTPEGEAKSEVASPAVPVLPAPSEGAKTAEEGKTAEEPANTGAVDLPAKSDATPTTGGSGLPEASGLPPADGGSGGAASGAQAGSSGDGK
jgi:preprotein translocase subunit SecG